MLNWGGLGGGGGGSIGDILRAHLAGSGGASAASTRPSSGPELSVSIS